MNVFEQVAAILSELSGMENIQSQQMLQEDLGLDSLQMITLLIMLEERFEIVLDESDMNPFDLTEVRQVVALAQKYTKGEKNEKEG